MKRTQVKEAGRSMQEILRQPLALPGEPHMLSLLQAAEVYSPAEGTHSHLAKILTLMAQHPEATDVLLRELELLQRSLNAKS